MWLTLFDYLLLPLNSVLDCFARVEAKLVFWVWWGDPDRPTDEHLAGEEGPTAARVAVEEGGGPPLVVVG